MILIAILFSMLANPSDDLLKMTFDGSDRELAQGAIERHDLRHREIEPRIWLIEVESGSAAEWAERLTRALPEGGGRFEGKIASPEEIEKVRRGEIKLQR
ncbi:MAG TPA: hypothetical protein VFM36_13035 [Thermoanaerobaculia bacterium]|nr:hypothetical protein [Thermoanaerobaculia bacterium]